MSKKSLCIVTVFFVLSSTAFAIDKHDMDESVVAPGARIVAGDLKKNEFFILGENEPLPSLPKAAPLYKKAKLHKLIVLKRQPHKIIAKRKLPKIKMALHKRHQLKIALHHRVHHKVRRVRV